MAYIYFYVRKDNGMVDYIGITRDAPRFVRRINEHLYYENMSFDEYIVDYIFVPSMAMADEFETELINRLQPPLNKQKKGYGINPFISFDFLAVTPTYRLSNYMASQIAGEKWTTAWNYIPDRAFIDQNAEIHKGVEKTYSECFAEAEETRRKGDEYIRKHWKALKG